MNNHQFYDITSSEWRRYLLFKQMIEGCFDNDKFVNSLTREQKEAYVLNLIYSVLQKTSKGRSKRPSSSSPLVTSPVRRSPTSISFQQNRRV